MIGDAMNNQDIQIGFIGGGNMSRAIISGLLDAGHDPDCLYVSDPAILQRERIQQLHADLHVTDDNVATLEAAAVIVLAVKPQFMAAATAEMRSARKRPNQLIMSIAAGVTLNTLQVLLDPAPAVVRIMPNQPAMSGAAMSVLIATTSTSSGHRELAQYVAEAMGRAVWIDDEDMMDAVTAISGSGPAYFYLLGEIIEAGAIEMGLPQDLARILTRQTAFGAGKTAIESELDLAELRGSVTSKGGTTAAAMAVLERAGFRDIVREALTAARDRSVELGNDTGDTDT
jgi:pyrroline-5-carboxylate reductase